MTLPADRFDGLVVRVPGELTHDADERAAETRFSTRPCRCLDDNQILMRTHQRRTGIDVSWRRQLTAAQVGSADLDLLLVGSEDSIGLVPATEDACQHGRQTGHRMPWTL